jgi:hypothetical protein
MLSQKLDLSNSGAPFDAAPRFARPRPRMMPQAAAGTFWPNLAPSIASIALAACSGATHAQAAPEMLAPDSALTSDASVPDADASVADAAAQCTTLETPTVGAWAKSLAADAGLYRGDLLTVYEFEGTIGSIALAGPDAGALVYPGSNSQKTTLSIVDTAGTPWSVGFTLPEPTTTLSIGDQVSVHYDHLWRSFDPEKLQLTIAKAGRTLVYVGVGGAVEDLTGAPARLVLGAPTCEATTDCLAYRGFDLLAVAEAGTVAIPLGATRTVGACRVTHDGAFHTVPGTTTCADAFVATVRVGAQCQP